MKLHSFTLSSEILRRGFWLYIWRIQIAGGRDVYYVGRTGDSSSLNAQSPFSRVSGHLGHNDRANALRRHLRKRNVEFEDCGLLEFVALGPLYSEGKNEAEHRQRRDAVAALERDLCQAMNNAGYHVMNTVHNLQPSDPSARAEVLAAFAERFPNLCLQDT